MPVTTAQELIEKSLKEILILGVQNTPTPQELNDGLDTLNLMLESWEIQSLACFGLETHSFALTGGVASYTIGPSGVWVMDRPQQVTGGYILVSQVKYYFTMVSKDSWNSIPYPSNQGIPSVAMYDPAMPNGIMSFYLTPSVGVSMTAFFDVYRPIQSFPLLTTQINLPKGYRWALLKCLALAQCNQYSIDPPPLLEAEARKAEGWIKKSNRNFQDNVVRFDPMILGTATYEPWGDTWL